MIHQDLLDEAIEVAERLSGIPKMNKDATRRNPVLAGAIVTAYATMRAARIVTNEEPPMVIIDDTEPEETEPEIVELPEPEPEPEEPEEVLVGPDGESVTIGGGASND